jgi:hypothetical protein
MVSMPGKASDSSAFQKIKIDNLKKKRPVYKNK